MLDGDRPIDISPPGLVADNLTWETVNTVNFGLDFGLFKHRFSLERYPLDELTSETFWVTENDLSAYTATYYSYLPNHDDVLWGDKISDNIAPARYNEIASGLHIPETGTWDWSTLRKYNLFLENYGKANIPESKKNEYAAETRLFRAWFYFDRVLYYGDVPYVDKVINISDTEILYGPRTDRNEVIDKVIEDLTYAAEHLPEERPLGRVNKYAALHLKARVCLFEGTFRKYHDKGEPASYLKQAVAAAEAVMQSGVYTLYSTGNPDKDYENLYTQNDLKGNKEMILFRQYDPVLYGHGDGWPIRHISVDNNGLTKDMVNDYLCIDGKPIGTSNLYKGDLTLEDEMKDRDPRLRQTIVPPGIGFFTADGDPHVFAPRLYVAKGHGSATSTGYHWRKAYNADAVLAYGKAETDLPVFRYAETLLTYAEAKAELGEATQEDINKSVNLIRARVGMPPMITDQLERDPDSDMTIEAGYLQVSVPVLIEEIRRERRVELVVENFRRNDLIRWRAGKFYEKPVLGARWSYFLAIKDANGEAVYDNASVGKDIWVDKNGYIEPYQTSLPMGRVFDQDKHYFMPIPLGELSLNPDLKQNPGW